LKPNAGEIGEVAPRAGNAAFLVNKRPNIAG
jgi:hypothetical protein